MCIKEKLEEGGLSRDLEMSSFSLTGICRNLNDRVRRPLGQVHGPTFAQESTLSDCLELHSFFLLLCLSLCLIPLQSSSNDQVNFNEVCIVWHTPSASRIH
jgi:hypothetical protein